VPPRATLDDGGATASKMARGVQHTTFQRIHSAGQRRPQRKPRTRIGRSQVVTEAALDLNHFGGKLVEARARLCTRAHA
jgi:hypothetical protein